MCKTEDRARPNGNGRSRGEGRPSDQAEGWGADTPDYESKLIRLANKKVSLIDVMRRYKIRVQRNPKRPDWSSNIKCPFHKGGRERTPSFGYSFKDNFFKCLACGASGGAVDFIALQEHKPRIAVAQRILEQYGGSNIESELIEDDDPKIEKAIISFGSYLNSYVQKNKDDPEALDNFHKLMWWFDQYLMKKVPKGNINIEELHARIEKVKELLDQ